MTENELVELVKQVLNMKCETQNIELKTAKQGCPENLYDTLSSFSNTKGGIIIFGIDEKHGYKVVGIDDTQILQKKVIEQSLSMEPVVRPLFTVIKYDDKIICSAEIPEMDSFSKPCFYKGKGLIFVLEMLIYRRQNMKFIVLKHLNLKLKMNLEQKKE